VTLPLRTHSQSTKRRWCRKCGKKRVVFETSKNKSGGRFVCENCAAEYKSREELG
jgi:transcription elongation factor Elf1